MADKMQQKCYNIRPSQNYFANKCLKIENAIDYSVMAQQNG